MIYYHSPEGEMNGKAINLLLIYAEPCQILHHREKRREWWYNHHSLKMGWKKMKKLSIPIILTAILGKSSIYIPIFWV